MVNEYVIRHFVVQALFFFTKREYYEKVLLWTTVLDTMK